MPHAETSLERLSRLGEGGARPAERDRAVEPRGVALVIAAAVLRRPGRGCVRSLERPRSRSPRWSPRRSALSSGGSSSGRATRSNGSRRGRRPRESSPSVSVTPRAPAPTLSPTRTRRRLSQPTRARSPSRRVTRPRARRRSSPGRRAATSANRPSPMTRTGTLRREFRTRSRITGTRGRETRRRPTCSGGSLSRPAFWRSSSARSAPGRSTLRRGSAQ